MSRVQWLAAAVVFGAGIAGARVADAQPPARPYPAVFAGAAAADPNKASQLNLSLEAASAYDDNLQAEITGPSGGGPNNASGYYSALSPSMAFAGRLKHLLVSATATGNARYYGSLGRVLNFGQSAGVALNAELTPLTTLSISQAFTYAPAQLYGLFAGFKPAVPGVPIDAASDYSVDAQRSYAYVTSATIARALSRRFTVSAKGGFRRTDFTGDALALPDFRGREFGGTMDYAISRNLRLRAGYTERTTEYSPANRPLERSVDVGMEYSRPLSGTRRVNLGFRLGPTIAEGVLSGDVSQGLRKEYRAVGEANIRYPFGRTWSIEGTARRGLGYVEHIANPVLTNAVTIRTGGFVNRRVDLTFSAGYTDGELALASAPPPFTTYTGAARVRIAVGKQLATFAEYLYYFYQFDAAFPLAEGLPRELTRNGVRVGLTLWVPVGQR